MHYLPPFAVQGTYRLSNTELSRYATLYKAMLTFLSHCDFSEDMQQHPYLNDWFLKKQERNGP
jgi:glutathione-regulated potassium-efflux system ancillary protein KefG